MSNLLLECLQVEKSKIVLKNKQYPWQVTLELTTKCNSSCIYCGRTALLNQGFEIKDLDMTTFYAIVTKLKVCRNLEKIVLGGWGEPLLHPEFAFIVETLKKELPKTKIKLYTNGICLSKHTDTLLKLDELTISLNHFDRETYLMQNRVDKYEVVVNNIIDFLNLKGERCPSTAVQLLSNDEELKKAFQIKWQGFLNCNDQIVFQPFENAGGLIETTTPEVFMPCYESLVHLCLSLDGDAYPCCLARTAGKKSDIYLGNVKEKSIKSIASSPLLKGIQNAQKDGHRSILKPCKDCNLWVKNSNHFIMLNKKWRTI